MSHFPTKSLARLLVKSNLWADSCIRIAKRACIGPMRMKTATAAQMPKRTPHVGQRRGPEPDHA